MPTELFNDGNHACIAFHDLAEDYGEHAVQCNQFLVIDRGEAALIDPGGSTTYSGLLMALQKLLPVKDLKFVLASHADPDVMASINKWFVSTGCRLAISRLWIRFVAHYTSGNVSPDRIIAIPDEGMSIRVGASNLKAVPAHFLHAEGNFQFYDPVSRILFSGDLGASMVPPNLAAQPVQNLEAHLRYMAGFHRRYMVCNKVCRFWAQMARGLDIEMIVPQHGSRIVGKPNIARFIDWVEALSCGVDLLGPDDYKIPA